MHLHQSAIISFVKKPPPDPRDKFGPAVSISNLPNEALSLVLLFSLPPVFLLDLTLAPVHRDHRAHLNPLVLVEFSSWNASMFSTHCAVASSPAPYCSRPGTSSKFAAPQALTLCATSARRAHVFSARVAPAVVLLHARGAIHDEVRRHATTLHSTISITVLGIAVLLIRCACCLVWIPSRLQNRAVETY